MFEGCSIDWKTFKLRHVIENKQAQIIVNKRLITKVMRPLVDLIVSQ